MNQTELFKRLGATLKNVRWSWGAVRTDGKVVLRVWEDETRIHENRNYVRLVRKKSKNSKHPGYRERLKHIEMMRSGAGCYMVMCKAKDVNASPRWIESFNETEVFVGGEVIELDGYWCIQIVKPKSVQSISA